MKRLLLFSLIIHCKVVQPFPVFNFNGTSPTSSATPSYAYLVKDVHLSEKFILCTSVKQARFDDVGFYLISGKDSGEWLTTQLRAFADETWLTVWWDEALYRVGRLQNPMLDIWYHICLNFDLKKNEIEASVNRGPRVLTWLWQDLLFLLVGDWLEENLSYKDLSLQLFIRRQYVRKV